MTMLKLSAIEDDKPIKLTHELSASVHRDLVAYAKSSHARADSRSMIQSMSLRLCWRGSWQRTEVL